MDNTPQTESSITQRHRFIFNSITSNLIQAPVSLLLDYLFPRMNSTLTSDHQMQTSITDTNNTITSTSTRSYDEELSIRIITSREQDNIDYRAVEQGYEGARVEEYSIPSTPNADLATESPHGEDRNGAEGNSSYQRYDIHQFGRYLEHIIPFSLLLLIVFIRQHLLGFFGTIWISVVLFKSNDILRKQTALKGDRKTSVLVFVTVIFILHVVSIYWWYPNNDLIYPLILLPIQSIPPFWHAIFIIVVNDTMVRQVAMVFKCVLLMYFKNSGGHNYRKQGQMLTLVEYMVLLYRALLPAPVWYSFFLNKEYGHLFSAFVTGFYLTFKLMSIIQKVQLFFAALRVLSHKEVHYGLYATPEQVNIVGDLCAICREKMHGPILLSCKHIFCEDCVSQWFERERTCPLCRSLVKPASIKSYSDGSTSLLFQLF